MALPRSGSEGQFSSSSTSVRHGNVQQQSQLQELLDSFSKRLMKRIDDVGDEVRNLVEECGEVELDLMNTFNSFRCLSSTQFVENRVYEEDETESFRAETHVKESQQSGAPSESYEEDILPRYKSAISTAWTSFQEFSRRRDEASRRARTRSSADTSLDNSSRPQILPFIIGTHDFARDINCGLGGLKHKGPSVDDVDSDSERDGATLATELVGADNVSEGEWSDAESEVGLQEGDFEPAVSAAMDFKAMLEAALRNPSLPNDGGSSDVTEQYVNNDMLLSNIAIDNYYDSSRSLSRTKGTGDMPAEAASRTTNASVSWSTSHLADPHVSNDVSLASVSCSEVVSSSLPSLTSRKEPSFKATIEKILEKSSNLKSQTTVHENKERKITSEVQQGEHGPAITIPFIPGGLFDDDDDDDTTSTGTHVANVSDSNTQPTVPDRLFQGTVTSGAPQARHVGLEGSSSFDPGRPKSPVRRSNPAANNLTTTDTNAVTKHQDTGNLVNKSHRDSSLSFQKEEITSTANETSSGRTTGKNPQQVRVRGGLFDDTDDEEEVVNLFGKSVSRKLSAVGANKQPVLPVWTTASSKGLFGDLDSDDVDARVSDLGNSARALSSSRQAGVVNEGYYLSPQKRLSPILAPGPTRGSSHPFSLSDKRLPSYEKHTSPPRLSATSSTLEQSLSSVRLGGSGGSSDFETRPSSSPKSSADGTGYPNEEFADSRGEGAGRAKELKLNIVASSPSNSDASFNSNRQKFNSGTESGLQEEELASTSHENLESLLAAGLRPSSHEVVNSSEDSESWSSSDSDDDSNIQKDQKMEFSESREEEGEISADKIERWTEQDQEQETEEKNPATDGSILESSGGSIVGGVRSPGSPEDSGLSMSLPRPGGSLVDSASSETSEKLESAEGLGLVRDHIDQSTRPSAKNSVNYGLDQQAQSVLSRSPEPFSTQNLKSSRGSPGSQEPYDGGRPGYLQTAKSRTFNSLFDDDSDEDLFGVKVSFKTGEKGGSHALTAPMDRPADTEKMKLIDRRADDVPSDNASPAFVKQEYDQDHSYLRHVSSLNEPRSDIVYTKPKSPVEEWMTKKPEARVPEPKLAALSPDQEGEIKVYEGVQSSGKKLSGLSSLLFGEEDEDNEDVLFGPMRGKSDGSKQDWLKPTSSSASSSTRRTASRHPSDTSLFDD